MVEHGQGPRPGSRDNGLRCAGYVAVGDVDPRVADDLLETLRAEGIAAYVAPTPGVSGGYLEVQIPSQLTDRLYVDSSQTDRASELLASAPARSPAVPPPPSDHEIDFEHEWRHLVGVLQAGDEPSDLPSPPAPDPEVDEHFVPPPPPPLPRLRAVTIGSLAAIIAGLVILITGLDGGGLVWLAILAILGGGGSLIYHVKEGPPTDSGWDDGAVV
ncbi:MAG TPA: hypothetical protein VME70_02130 [Mycobacteriales bacterium]|nr:hypothetical protein [Mycobacteriales bacterium]